jgi:hypothetical protein
VDFVPGVEGNLSAIKTAVPGDNTLRRSGPLRKGAQVFWRGKIATIANDPIEDFDILIKFEDGQILTVHHSALLSEQGAESGCYPVPLPNAAADDLTKAQLSAWNQAQADAAAVEGTLGVADVTSFIEPFSRGKYARHERLLLDRLRSKKYAVQVSDAWRIIAKHRKKAHDDSGERVVKSLLNALTLCENAARVSDEYRKNIERLKELKSFADQLHEYFTDTIERDPDWKIVAGDAKLWSPAVERDPDWKMVAGNYLNATPRFKSRMIQPLRRIQLFLTNRMAKFANIFDQVDLTREINTPVAKRVIFTMAMSNSMQNIFGRGRGLDDLVALLTEVAFECVIDSEKVKRARKDAAARRKKR